MADITITAAAAHSGIQPLEGLMGVPLTVFSTYTFSASPTVSQKIYMCKIPDGARVLDVRLLANNVFNKGGVSVVSVGTNESQHRFISSCTPSVGLTFIMGGTIGNGGIGGVAATPYSLGWHNDMSDNASPKYRFLQVTVSAAASTSSAPIITTSLTYVMDKSTSAHW